MAIPTTPPGEVRLFERYVSQDADPNPYRPHKAPPRTPADAANRPGGMPPNGPSAVARSPDSTPYRRREAIRRPDDHEPVHPHKTLSGCIRPISDLCSHSGSYSPYHPRSTIASVMVPTLSVATISSCITDPLEHDHVLVRRGPGALNWDLGRNYGRVRWGPHGAKTPWPRGVDFRQDVTLHLRAQATGRVGHAGPQREPGNTGRPFGGSALGHRAAIHRTWSDPDLRVQFA